MFEKSFCGKNKILFGRDEKTNYRYTVELGAYRSLKDLVDIENAENEYLLTKISFDITENRPPEIFEVPLQNVKKSLTPKVGPT